MAHDTLDSLAAVAGRFGVTKATVKTWRRRGMPGERQAYSESEITTWLHKNNLGPYKHRAADSPPLERFREWKAKHAALDYAERQSAVIGRDRMKDILSRLASCVRRAGAELAKKHGPGPAKILNEAMSDFEAVVEAELSKSAAYSVDIEDDADSHEDDTE